MSSTITFCYGFFPYRSTIYLDPSIRLEWGMVDVLKSVQCNRKVGVTEVDIYSYYIKTRTSENSYSSLLCVLCSPSLANVCVWDFTERQVSDWDGEVMAHRPAHSEVKDHGTETSLLIFLWMSIPHRQFTSRKQTTVFTKLFTGRVLLLNRNKMRYKISSSWVDDTYYPPWFYSGSVFYPVHYHCFLL